VLESAEIVVEVELPASPADAGWAFEETARRSGDFALAAVSVLLTMQDGRCAEARIAMMGVGETPLRAAAAEALVKGRPLDTEAVGAAAAAARDAAEPMTDLHASADYRRHLVEVLARRALADAWRRAGGSA
jgi:carbon-monoxide dehydrogenase medium subunit